MVGDKYILEPEAILDHCVAAEGKRWYLVKWKPKWVKKHELPEGVYEKWEAKKAKRAKLEIEGEAEGEPEADEEESGFRILEERRVVPGQDPEEGEKVKNGGRDKNGEEEEEEEEDDEGLDDEDEEEPEDEDEEDEEEGMDEDDEEDLEGVEVKEEPEDEEEEEDEFNGAADLATLSSVDRDIVLNGLPGELEPKEEAEIKEEEDRISIPTNYTKPYS